VIRIIDGLPDHVVGVEAIGKVTAADYESVLLPAVVSALAGDSRCRMLLVFGREFEGYEAEAALDDMKMGLHNWGDFERIAFVSDNGGYRALVRGFGFLMPGEVKLFAVEELDAAKAWVTEPNV
jgi:hypothetical protein